MLPWRIIGEFLGIAVGLAVVMGGTAFNHEFMARMDGWRNPYYLPILIIASGIGTGVGGIAGFGLGRIIEMIGKARKKSQLDQLTRSRRH